jgi:hypothetical protein
LSDTGARIVRILCGADQKEKFGNGAKTVARLVAAGSVLTFRLIYTVFSVVFRILSLIARI